MKANLKVINGKYCKKSPVLEADSIGKIFRVNGVLHSVLENISFKANPGELICILGRSGCGKTTLLNILAGFLTPSSGRVLVDGTEALAPGPDRCVVFQEDALFPWLTVEENVALGLRGRIRSKKDLRTEVDRFLELVGLSAFRSYLPREISGGMKQRVALARVLILQPKALLMDEPFASLDAQSREEMQGLLLCLWEKLSHTIFFVTHDVNEAALLADRVLVMAKDPGRIKIEATVDLPRPRIREQGDFISFSRELHQELKH
jgi:NitT/TauT family transport system ATP-binding protein